MTTTERLEAGRELDELVAVEVFGFVVREYKYSTTGDGMLAVLERMGAQGWDVEVVADDDGWIVKYAGEHAVFAPTLPHAVCLAALEAVRA